MEVWMTANNLLFRRQAVGNHANPSARARNEIMKINADLSKRAAVCSTDLAWVPSPLPGVERRMLERDGGEVARVTSVVRYAPGSRFSEHTHGGGEEYLVLQGIFSDNHGDFPTGTYVRNPVGTRHAPHSDDGTVILVKLWWMHPEDQECVRIDTTCEDLWRAASAEGVEVMGLHRFANECTMMYRMIAGAALPARVLPGGEEVFVVDGSCHDDNGTYAPGTWVRTPIGKAPRLVSDQGCRLLVTRGHLLDPPPQPGRGI
jgi:anti-sigma factor ChrR (cupin superfamily)